MGSDYVHLDGRGAEANAQIFVINNSAPPDKFGVVALADGMGNWQCDIWGHKGDALFVEQVVGRQPSPGITFIIR